MSRHMVWHVPGSRAALLLENLPDDLEPRPLSEPRLPACPASPGVLLVDLAGGDADSPAMTAALRAGLPIVALVDAGASDASWGQPYYAYLTSAVPARALTTVLRQACEHARVTFDALETSTQLDELNTIGIRLSAERNLESLLELILTKGREITRSDAGSLYVVEPNPDGGQRLRFKLAQNDSVHVPFSESTLPISADSVAGYVALSGEILRIDDAYALAPDSPCRINMEFDARGGYRTTSMLVGLRVNERCETRRCGGPRRTSRGGPLSARTRPPMRCACVRHPAPPLRGQALDQGPIDGRVRVE
jgi:hypothetical protein